VEALSRRWPLAAPTEKFNARIAEGRIRPGGPRVVVMQPLTYMNESGKAVGPARGKFKIPPDRIVVAHDEIDLPFGEVRVRMGGGLAGHRGLKSLDRHLGTREFWRVRVGVGRPESTEPEQVAAYVLGRFRNRPEEVEALVANAADEVESLVERLATDGADGGSSGAGFEGDPGPGGRTGESEGESQ
jgi:PTH1 family peptidyl-tRNA hydrolase